MFTDTADNLSLSFQLFSCEYLYDFQLFLYEIRTNLKSNMAAMVVTLKNYY